MIKITAFIKRFFKEIMLCIMVLVCIISIYIHFNYDLTTTGTTNYPEISFNTLENSSMTSIHDDLKKQGYTSYAYGFNLSEESASNTTYKKGDDIDVTINLPYGSAFNNKIVNIYSYNKSTNIFECLGEAKASDMTLSFKTTSLGEYFITLPTAPTYDSDNESLVFNEEFNYTGLPGSDWTYDVGNNDGWGNKESEYYTAYNLQNSNVENGTLNITAKKENYDGYHYTSARLVSKNSYLYGKFEICAKLPEGDGTWPAIWMLPAVNTYGNWPDSGEIDIMEAIGRQPNYVHGSLQMNAYNFKQDNQKTASLYVNDLYSSYHVYEVLWTPNKIQISVDGHVYLTYNRDVYDIGPNAWKAWPYNKAFKMLLNIAVGGTYGGAIDNSIFPQTMSIKYIKVYSLNLNNYNLNTVSS